MPSHIRASGIADAPIRHKWSDEIQDDVLLDQPRLRDRLSALSDRAVLAFTVGSVEWVVWRFAAHLPDRTAIDAVEAAWAGIVDWRYLKNLEVPSLEDEDEVPEKISGPLDQAFWLLGEAFTFAEDGEPFWQFGASASELAIRVVPTPDKFKSWRRVVIKRLTECYPRPEDALGPPVPRDLLEPEARCEPESIVGYLSRFLAGLKPTENPYLVLPKEMVSAGFEGKPYSL
jgi:hypothetical protein